LAGVWNLAQHIAIEIERHDPSGVAMSEPDGLIRRHEQPAGRAGMLRLADIIAVSIKHLNAAIAAVGDVEQPFGVKDNRVRHIKLAGCRAGLAPCFDEVAGGVEFEDTGLALAVALQHVERAVRPYRRLARLVEQPQMAEFVPFAGTTLDAENHL